MWLKLRLRDDHLECYGLIMWWSFRSWRDQLKKIIVPFVKQKWPEWTCQGSRSDREAAPAFTSPRREYAGQRWSERRDDEPSTCRRWRIVPPQGVRGLFLKMGQGTCPLWGLGQSPIFYPPSEARKWGRHYWGMPDCPQGQGWQGQSP